MSSGKDLNLTFFEENYLLVFLSYFHSQGLLFEPVSFSCKEVCARVPMLCHTTLNFC